MSSTRFVCRCQMALSSVSAYSFALHAYLFKVAGLSKVFEIGLLSAGLFSLCAMCVQTFLPHSLYDHWPAFGHPNAKCYYTFLQVTASHVLEGCSLFFFFSILHHWHKTNKNNSHSPASLNFYWCSLALRLYVALKYSFCILTQSEDKIIMIFYVVYQKYNKSTCKCKIIKHSCGHFTCIYLQYWCIFILQ